MSSNFIVVMKTDKMASKAGRHAKIFFETRMFVERLTLDVLVYTLTKCGLPASSLPTTNCDENIYRRTDFLKTAGASVLRISLVMRDTWRRMFKSRRDSCGFTIKNIPKFISSLLNFYRTGRTHCIPSVLEFLLALCNEIILYFHFENISIDFNDLTTLIGDHMAFVTGLNRNDHEKLEALFDSFDDISGYTEWITDFISKFAIPYGSSDDVSDLFFEHVRKKFEEDVKKLTDSYRFLPYDHFSAITAGISEKSAELTSIRRDGQSPEPPNSTMDSEVGTLEKSKFLGSRSTRTENSSEPLSQNQSSKLEQRVADEGLKGLAKIIFLSNERISLSQQKLPTDSEIGKKSKSLAKSTAIQSDSKSRESPKFNSDSEMGAVGGKTFLGNQSTCTVSENVSELLSENKQNSEIPSEVGIEQDLEKMTLDVEETSQETQDAKTKRKKSKKGKSVGKKKGLENLSQPASKPSDIKSLEAPKLPTDSETCAVGGKKSENLSEPTSIKGILLLSSFVGFTFLVMCYKIYTRKRRFK